MIIGLDYVIIAYAIWVITFVLYIILIKRRLKIITHSISVIEKRNSVKTSSDGDDIDSL